MKLSEAKRRLKVGMTIDAVGHYRPAASGPRTVTKVQGNGFYYSTPSVPRGWCTWPPATMTRSAGPDSILLMMDERRPLTTLTYPPEEAP